MPLLAILSFAVQGFFIWHFLRRSCCADRMMLYILMIPGIGPAIYFFLVFLPEELHATEKAALQSVALRFIDPERDYKRARLDCERAPTIPNRHALARVLIARGDAAQAETMLRGILAEPMGEDATTLTDLAEALAAQTRYAEARQMLVRAQEMASAGARTHQIALAQARLYEGEGNLTAAEEVYQCHLDVIPGEEVRCSLAALWVKTGRYREAWDLLDEISRRLRTGGKSYARQNREWAGLAGTLRSELQKKAQAQFGATAGRT